MTPCPNCADTARMVYDAVEDFKKLKRDRFIIRIGCSCPAEWGRASHRDFSQTENGELFWRADIGIVTEWPE